MGGVDADRNLLFGVLALQDDLIDAHQFADACASWALRKDVALSEILVQRGWITPAESTEVARRLERKLKKHGGDAHATLGAVAGAEARAAIERAEDPEVRRSLDPLPSETGFVQVETLVKTDTVHRSRYTLTRLHAEGGLGKVWIARDVDLNREVALKEIRPDRAGQSEARQRFLKEAQVTGQLEHPNIVPVYELGERPEDGQPFYTMRLIKGRTLRRAIADYHRRQRDGSVDPLALPELLRAFVSICLAISYAHSRGVYHRDLKPDNVVLGDFGEVIVLDWGIAKLAKDVEVNEGVLAVGLTTKARADETRAGLPIGTPAYMAPEQAAGRLDLIDERTDVYGLGAILFEILTGNPPHKGNSTDAVLASVINGPSPRARMVDPRTHPALDAICTTAMAHARAERYPTGKDLARDVERWLADEPVTVYREGSLRRARRWAKKHRAAVQTTAAVALVVGGLATVAIARNELRINKLAKEAIPAIEAAQQAIIQGEESAVPSRLTPVLTLLDAEPRLAALAHRARAVLNQAQNRLEEAAARRRDRDRYEAFLTNYDDVLQHATFSNQQSAARNRERIKAAAWETLLRYGLTPAGAEEPALAQARIDPREKAKAKASCYELLLLIAYLEILEDERGIHKALALIDRADRLIPGGQAAQSWRERLPRADQARPRALETASREEASFARAVDRFHSGLVEYIGQSHARATSEFEAALREFPDHYWASYYLALCFIKTGRLPEAKAALVGCLARKPNAPWVHMLKAQVDGQSGAVDAAEQGFARALELARAGTASHAEIEYATYVNRGANRIGWGRLTEAIDDLREAANMEPDQPQAFVNLTLAYQKLEKWEDGQRAIDRAASLDPRAALVAKDRALFLLERATKDRGLIAGRAAELRREAELEFQRAIALTPPRSPFRLMAEAETLARKGDLATALERFNQYARAQLPDADFYQKRGQVLAQLDRYPEAVDDYNRALQLKPNTNTFARRGWAILLHAETLAEHDFDRSVQASKDPKKPNLDGLIGRAYARVKLARYDEAIVDADQVPVAEIGEFDILFNLACVYAQAAPRAAQFGDRAIEVLRASLSRVKEPARPAVWKQMAADRALDPIRTREDFRKLDNQHGTGKQ